MSRTASDIRLVYVTAPDARTARRLARLAVDRRLAACANWVPGLRSVYRWEGRIEESAETALILKTVRRRLPALEAAIREHHPYDCPCFVHWAPAGGAPAFLEWIRAGTRGAGKKRTP